MKSFIVLILLATITGCSCGRPEEVVQPFTKDQQARLVSMVNEIRPQVAKCELLAKCMGFSLGEVRTLDIGAFYTRQGYDGQPNQTIRFEVSCFLSAKGARIFSKQVSLSELDPMLKGCQSKSCGKECDGKAN